MALCPGYESRQSSRVHWVTAQGQRGHDALETGDSGDLESDFEAFMVGWCNDYVDSVLRDQCTTLDACEVLDEVQVETIEKRWGYFDRFVIHRNDSGTRSGTADMFDWKFVKVKEAPPAEINLQGHDYVIGVFEDPKFADIHTIKVHFVMPRFQKVTTAVFHRKGLPKLKLEIYSVLRRAKRTSHGKYAGKDLTPHYDACTYCKHSGKCNALRQVALDVRKRYDPEGAGDLSVPELTHASDAKMTPEQRGELQKLAGVMEAWAKAVKYHNSQAALDDPNAVAGFAIDMQKGRRKVVGVPALLAVCETFDVSSDDLVECSQLAFGKVEAIIRSKAPKGEKGKAVASFNLALRTHDAIEDSAEVPKLVKVSPTVPDKSDDA